MCKGNLDSHSVRKFIFSHDVVDVTKMDTMRYTHNRKLGVESSTERRYHCKNHGCYYLAHIFNYTMLHLERQKSIN